MEMDMISGISGAYGAGAYQGVTGASAKMPPSGKMASLFSKIDTDNDGTINKSQFLQAFQTMKPTAGFRAMGADAVYGSLNQNASGQVSQQDFVQGMTSLMAQFRANGVSTG